jgi:hypothetical protein
MNATAEPLLARREVPDYLRRKYGEPAVRSAKYLAKIAGKSTGPVMVLIGRKVGYRPSDIDRWILGMTRSRTSTSDPGESDQAS